MAEYQYPLTDFPNQKADEGRLVKEISESSISIVLLSVSVDSGGATIKFADLLSDADKTTLDEIVAAHSGEPLDFPPCPAMDDFGRTVVVPEPQAEKKSLIIVTHNWCDRCTWYQQSTKVEDEALVDSGDGLTFGSAHACWIDLQHGRQYAEDRITADGTYIPVVKVDGVEKTMREPFQASGGDYEIDYEHGRVVFFESQAGKTVTATYWYSGSSLFTISPEEGKTLWLISSEVQFSSDVVMNDTVHFQAWAYNPYDLPNKVPVTKKTTYKRILDFVSEARGCYPVIPAIGGAARGIETEHVTFPFQYLSVKELRASQGLEVRIWLEHDQEFDGQFGNASFYCLSYDEE